jgi:hypothetical protein
VRSWAAGGLAVAALFGAPGASGAGLVAAPHATASSLVAAPRVNVAGLLASARLQGVFVMSGLITDAVNTGGEHRGEVVRRTWTFISRCPTGACPTVELTRTRNRTLPPLVDQLVLRRRSPGFYSGTSTFIAPMVCAGQRYAKGEAVPFSVTVRVTAARTVGGQVLATGLRAFYRNPKRIGLTKCVTAAAHDAARYTGRLVVSPGGATRSVRSTPSSTVS